MTPLILILWACAPAETDGTGDPGTSGTNPTDTTEERFQPIPLGVEVVPTADLQIDIDSAVLRCEGSEGTLQVDTFGLADGLELDLVTTSGIVTIDMTPESVPEDAVWVSFKGTADCSLLESGTWLARAFRDGEQQDCAVHGTARADVLAGAHDADLVAAGRPGAAGCLPITD